MEVIRRVLPVFVLCMMAVLLTVGLIFASPVMASPNVYAVKGPIPTDSASEDVVGGGRGDVDVDVSDSSSTGTVDSEAEDEKGGNVDQDGHQTELATESPVDDGTNDGSKDTTGGDSKGEIGSAGSDSHPESKKTTSETDRTIVRQQEVPLQRFNLPAQSVTPRQAPAPPLVPRQPPVQLPQGDSRQSPATNMPSPSPTAAATKSAAAAPSPTPTAAKATAPVAESISTAVERTVQAGESPLVRAFVIVFLVAGGIFYYSRLRSRPEGRQAHSGSSTNKG